MHLSTLVLLSVGVVLAAPANLANRGGNGTGTAEGFAAGVTGGGSSMPVYPTTTQELVTHLSDS